MPGILIAPLSEKIQFLKKHLSPEATINTNAEADFATLAARWNDLGAPQPGALVNVATEADVAETVKWANENGVKYLAQGGGHGYQTTWAIGNEDIIINTRGLAATMIDTEAWTASIRAGTLVGEANNVAQESKAHLVLGTCNSVGALGAILGGGVGNFQGIYGLSADNLISARMVTAKGELTDVSATCNPDLFYALRGAGHNFGIVTSAVVKAYPAINDGMHWTSLLVFPPPRIAEIVEVINTIELKGRMSLHIFFMKAPPIFQPTFAVSLWYAGTEAEGREAWKDLLAAGPVAEMGGMTPYNHLNDGADTLTFKGGRKPCYSTSMPSLSPMAVAESWNLFLEWISYGDEVGMSALMYECYSTEKVKEVADEETPFPWRNYGVHCVALIKYSSPSLDSAARATGEKFRDLLREHSGMEKPAVYINFAVGDEPVEEMYGGEERVAKLKEIKEKWDPERKFNEYHPFC